MIENGFVYAIGKYSIQKAKLQAKQDKKTSKFYDICRKYNTDIYGLSKEVLTKAELKFVLEYIEKILEYPLEWYPKLNNNE